MRAPWPRPWPNAARAGHLRGAAGGNGPARAPGRGAEQRPHPGQPGHLDRLFLGAQAAGRIMLDQGFGAIVNLTGITGQIGLTDTGLAGPEAAAVGMLTRTMACEWGGSGIRANALAAGLVEGDAPTLLPRVPLRRMARPAEIAAVAAFLLSPAAGFISGSIVPVDGGLSAHGGLDFCG
ncbi:SDR family oxidoreductase [Pseudoroseomonas wenyumeiae]